MRKSYISLLLENIIEESLVHSKTNIANLVNRLDDKIQNKLKKYNVQTKIISSGHSIKNKSEITSYYLIISIKYPYQYCLIPIEIKCRCSNHIKFDFSKEKDIDVFIPNYKIFKDQYKKDYMYYLLSDKTNDEYINQGFQDIIHKIEIKLTKILNILKQINPQIIDDIQKLSASEIITKYDFLYPIYFQSWFKDYINRKTP